MYLRDSLFTIKVKRQFGRPAQGGIHYELGQAFYEIGRDYENRVVIMTGTGDNFCNEDRVIRSSRYKFRLF